VETFHAKYEVRYDVEAARRMGVAGMRHYWFEWLKVGFKGGLNYVAPAAFAWAIVSFYADRYSSQGLLVVVLLALSMGLFYPVYTFIQVADRRERDPNAGEVWQCEITDEGWGFTDRQGVSRFIPWKIMKLTFEHDDGWLLSFGAEQIWVFRGPLREAGLEEAFRSRIGKGAESESG